MSKVIFDISTSLDGFITGANPHQDAEWGGLGQGGERLHDWGFKSTDPYNQQVMTAYPAFGANIFGRTGYDHSILNWGADGPSGAARVPTIIVSHSIPENVPDHHIYTFVSGIEAAYEQAKTLAGDKDIYVAGANVARQLLTRGLIDEIVIHLVPVLFGSGTRLFEGLDRHVELEPLEAVKTPEATHLRFRVVK